ncbi:DNA-directed RNA polymerase subunit beta' [Bifidobacterium animalis subsp. animalis MCC 1489]|uniref:DNA-directed RNA polymerase subunit beta' n=1 Tax=Bifidobacterium animalis subsp. animalis IM386 TaxID=1402194 RepID=A0AAV2W3R6_9BIFI|nr:DNA-directed RNA polymerase subunit beta' [Bifidobacterium animalis]AFI63517.1 DNA-directed RNA polymerase subunit beta' [Bifidobacterium animalis subsp. animalis ATCC 25527]AYN24144.1 DNA-directed RNA polymerase subunit beta' [Bifidobacterium animalis subsp. animalis]KFI41697.1 DNA-directed RNA polymerase subunit beta [Bifidobacterium animalis subsp. animalis]KOA63575.1 DNA-directed RNA polymerase subunit beta' [Bifidobacterium animalis subsp. animalis MCC 1489]CDI68165.1 DNA-directed RNA 
MLDVNAFDKLKIGLATADDIRGWSYGEVKKPETINYRTLKPEKDGLFGEQIFGPTRDWECACGKYKRVRFKGIVCERCGVEVTRSRVRRERMGHIELAAPVTHIWFFKGVPSRLGYLLGIPPKDLEKVIYFASYMVTSVDEEQRHRDLPDLQDEFDHEVSNLERRRNNEIEERAKKLEADLAELEADGEVKGSAKTKLRNGAERDMAAIRQRYDDQIKRIAAVFDKFKSLKPGDMESDVDLWREMEDRYGDYFEGCMGAEAIKKRLQDFDLEAAAKELREEIETGTGQRKARALKRLKVVNAFLTTDNKPEAMVLDVIPVIPPDLRPMVQLDGGRFATSDLNDLYRRVINRNNRLKRLIELGAPEIMLNNEKRMLQEAVDSLFDNGRRGRPVTGASNRPLKSLSDMLKGKQGRFRQNLLGKRVDYSGRSVIVVGPSLRMHQCGLPKPMALELFKPFVIKRLVDLNYAQNMKSAKRLVDRGDSEVWGVLEEVISEHPVLLNRAPTLHRLGIQAFEPILVEGKAIHLPPLACAAFNADFDGDQMAVHLPLSAEAQAEARSLMMASDNILKPADGHTVTMPSQDMILGLYYLSTVIDGAKGQGRIFSSLEEAQMALDKHEIDMQAKVLIRLPQDFVLPKDWEPGEVQVIDPEPGSPDVVKEERFADGSVLFATSLGRILFNDTLPVDYPFINEQAPKGKLSKIVDDVATRYSTQQVAATLDALKDLGFTRAPWSGVTMAFSDIVAPPDREEIIKGYEAQAAKVNNQYDLGLLTEEERRQELINLWTECTDKVAEAMRENFHDDNNVNIMVQSGARGNWMQIRQIAGMRGLVANPKGEIIPRPVKSNYREGLSVLEYFISQHGARKGLADTALRTAESGYLTRRLVDVSQEIIVREEDCGTTHGLPMTVAEHDENGNLVLVKAADGGPYSRLLAQDVLDPADGKTVLYHAGDALSMDVLNDLVAHGVEQVIGRSVLTCESKRGVCAKCYGWSLATNKLVDVGEAVGIVAAQSIGEPGTQLTLRSFHSGGVASASDITQGLPRVTELFEARTPKGEAPISEFAGTIKVQDTERGREVILQPDDDSLEPITYQVTRRAPMLVKDGQHVDPGTQLVEGSVDPKKILRILGPRAAQMNIVNEVHDVYRSQGVDIHDKHIEVIVHQMLRRVTVIDSGDTGLLPGELVDRARFREQNKKTVAAGGRPAAGRPELMGITKASLATDSWLSAASFQETTRVLTEAALNEKEDDLKGLKENVIIGKLIPAGTGLARYRNATVEPDKAIRDTIYPNFGLSDDSLSGDFGDGDLGDVDFSNIDFGDLKLGDDFNPDDFLDDNDNPVDFGDEFRIDPDELK